MTKDDLVDYLAATFACSKAQARQGLNDLGEFWRTSLQVDGAAVIPGIGRIGVSYRQPMRRYVPASGATQLVPGRYRAKLRPSRELVAALNPPQTTEPV